MLPRLKTFVESESAGGVALALAALVAIVVANSPLAASYRELVSLRGELRIADPWLVLSKPLSVWVNDLWMAVFFFLVGLEIKREMRDVVGGVVVADVLQRGGDRLDQVGLADGGAHGQIIGESSAARAPGAHTAGS